MAQPHPLVIPYQQPPFTDEQIQTNLQVIQRWVNTLSSGGYASLTGPGQTATPGELDQAGAFTVTTPVSDTTGIYLTDQGTGGIGIETASGTLGLDTTTGSLGFKVLGGSGDINLTNDGTGSVLISAFTGIMSLGGSGGIEVTDDSSSGLTITETGSGGITLTDDSAGITLVSPASGATLFTADVLAHLPTPATAPAWGFTQDGHIYFYPSGGPWTLKV